MILGRFICCTFDPLPPSRALQANLGIEIVRNFDLAPSFPKLQFRVLLLNLYLFPLFISRPTHHPQYSIQTIPCSAGTASAVLSVLLIS
jgi:hypothetical protein